MNLFRSIILLVFIGLNVQQTKAQLTTLLTFNNTNGSYPLGSLYSDGIFLYGMTNSGGTNSLGTIFKIKPDGTSYDTLLNFNGMNGQSPRGSLISDGTFLYGTTHNGGWYGDGIVFKIMPNGTGFDTVLTFKGANGEGPPASLLQIDTDTRVPCITLCR